MNKNSIIGILAVVAIALLVGMLVASKKDVMEAELETIDIAPSVMQDNTMMAPEGDMMMVEGDAMMQEGEVMEQNGDAMMQEGDMMNADATVTTEAAVTVETAPQA